MSSAMGVPMSITTSIPMGVSMGVPMGITMGALGRLKMSKKYPKNVQGTFLGHLFDILGTLGDMFLTRLFDDTKTDH